MYLITDWGNLDNYYRDDNIVKILDLEDDTTVEISIKDLKELYNTQRVSIGNCDFRQHFIIDATIYKDIMLDIYTGNGKYSSLHDYLNSNDDSSIIYIDTERAIRFIKDDKIKEQMLYLEQKGLLSNKASIYIHNKPLLSMYNISLMIIINNNYMICNKFATIYYNSLFDNDRIKLFWKKPSDIKEDETFYLMIDRKKLCKISYKYEYLSKNFFIKEKVRASVSPSVPTLKEPFKLIPVVNFEVYYNKVYWLQCLMTDVENIDKRKMFKR